MTRFIIFATLPDEYTQDDVAVTVDFVLSQTYDGVNPDSTVYSSLEDLMMDIGEGIEP